MTEIRRPLHIADNNVEELNRVLMYIQDRLDEIEGRRGTPTFKANLNLDGNRITNASQGTAPGEMLTADLEATDLELSDGNLRVKVATEKGLERTTRGIGLKADITKGLTIDNLDGLQALVKSGGGISIDATEGLYADQSFVVGSVYLSTLSTNPATLLGYGTWAAVATGTLEIGDGWDGAGLVASGGQGNLAAIAITLYIWQRTA